MDQLAVQWYLMCDETNEEDWKSENLENERFQLGSENDCFKGVDNQRVGEEKDAYFRKDLVEPSEKCRSSNEVDLHAPLVCELCGLSDGYRQKRRQKLASDLMLAFVNTRDDYGNSALHLAVEHHNLAAITWLVKRDEKERDMSAGTLSVVVAAFNEEANVGPFREAVDSQLRGDRRTYQLDPANAREGVKEAVIDAEEGADIVMVKPAQPYLDVLADVRAAVDIPVWAYQVSGEYAMIEAAAANGWIDRRAAIQDSLLGIRRAGADAILTYWAAEAATWLAAAIDFAWHEQPRALRERIPVNATVPAVEAARVPEVLARFDGCRTAKVKVAERGQTLADDVARVEAVRDALGPGGLVRVDANGAAIWWVKTGPGQFLKVSRP
jgi:hypothetical protein